MMELNKNVLKYLEDVMKEWKTKAATEHSYRPALKSLLETLLPELIVINEPSHIPSCGAPDYILRHKHTLLNVAFVEAKNIGDNDLEGNGIHKEQFSRYKHSLETLCITDYLDFHFYTCGEFLDRVRIAEINGDKIVPASEANIEKFVSLIEHFGAAKAQTITSPGQLASLMAGKARLLAQALQESLRKDADKTSDLAWQMKAFRDALIHDMSEEEFADVYAQTITYGMFAARLHDDTPETFTRHEAAALIPKSNPFLRKLFIYIGANDNEDIEWIVDDLIMLFAATDLREIMKDYGKSTEQTDPILHFYEDFLAAYNPALRKCRGVWYTPQPVVRFIVRSVDRILETDFGLQGGLANNEKTIYKVKNDDKVKKKDKDFIEKETHRVQILDPAAGTGTFLAETIRQIHSKFACNQGRWQSYVSEHLLPRLNGFEILIASYAMAHLKLDMLLAETGYRHDTGERFRVFLTNSLEEHAEETGTLFAAALSSEANEANFIKRDCPVMVVIGNPPYSGESQNKGEAIMRLMEDYKKEPGGKEKLKERNPKWINDDYVKFIRMAQYYIDRNGEGVLGYICPHGFLDNPTFRGMRWNLLNSFDKIYTLNLHGNAKKKEVCPDGSKDENVFDIMQGVSINLFIKHARHDTAKKPLAEVYYADLWGTRDYKYDTLNATTFESVQWQKVDYSEPMYFFVPKDMTMQDAYHSFFAINDFFKTCLLGPNSHRDDFAISFTYEEAGKKLSTFSNKSFTNDELLQTLGLKNGRDWNISDARNMLKGNERPCQCLYRPFDKRYMLYGDYAFDYHRPLLNDNIIKGSIAIAYTRQTRENFSVLATDIPLGQHKIVTPYDGSYASPLYLYSDSFGAVEKTPNLDKEIWSRLNAAVGFETTPEDVFNYIYAVLHTPEYRERYREFLKIDFPRIPYPKNGDVFRRLAEIGHKLIQIHLLKDSETKNMFNPLASFPESGTNRVDCLKFADGKVHINDSQYFDSVPETVWDFFIGGYQPAQKWLKDRKGRVLTDDDVTHYHAIIIALDMTRRLMSDLSALSKDWMES